MRYRFIPTSTASIWGNQNVQLFAAAANILQHLLRKVNTYAPNDPEIPLLGICSREMKNQYLCIDTQSGYNIVNHSSWIVQKTQMLVRE